MLQSESLDRQRKFLPSLEGIRGYAFLLVFFYHYFWNDEFPFQRIPWLYPLFLIKQIAWIAVPMFFVLSGYLICGILIDTRDKEGYFKVFYTRRILRVFPPYYIALVFIGVVGLLGHVSLDYRYYVHFFYIQNLLPAYPDLAWLGTLRLGHLWSMAVEEQFYLLWPLVVWLCPNKRVLLRVTVLFVGASCAIRFASHWANISAMRVYTWTPTRLDAILLGALLAIVRRDAIYKKLEPLGKYIALAGIVTLMAVAAVTGDSWPIKTHLRAALLIPLVNVLSAGLILGVLEPGSFLCRACSQRWICWLGSRSYGLYLFHFLFLDWLARFGSQLAMHMPRRLAYLLGIALAFSFTLVLAAVCYTFVEQPAMNLKRFFPYGRGESIPGGPGGAQTDQDQGRFVESATADAAQ